MIIRLHQTLSSFVTYILLYYIFNFDKLSAIILAIFVGFLSTIPDFDYKIFTWSNKQYMFLNKTKLKYPLFPYYLFILFLIKVFKHRGITHSIFPVLFFFILGFFIISFFYLFSLAFLLHMLEDSLTVSGIQPFYPLSNYKFVIPILNNKKHRNIQIILSYLIIFIFIYFIIFL
ncbi:hypothetical protein YN1_2180 [Nanoarchaeota archaeon]